MIFSHNDYRSYLKAYIASQPKKGFGESKKIAAFIGVSSTFFSQILSGDKQLSLEQTTALSEYIGLSNIESEYLFYLVNFDRAGTLKFKNFCKEKLDGLKKISMRISERVKVSKALTEEEKTTFYSSALYSAVSLFTSTQENGVTLEDIEKRFYLPRGRATEIIRFCLEAGLCVEKSGRYCLGTQSTHLGQNSPHLAKHHTNWRIRAIQALEDLEHTELMYTTQVSLSKKDFEKIREEIVIFIKRFLETVHASPAEDIACLNIDWFRIRK